MLRIVALASAAAALAPPARPVRQAHRLHSTAENVAQTQETSRDKVMTFSYDTERERKYAKPVYKGTGDGLGGDEGEYDVVVIGSGMGGLACGAMCAKYGESSIVLESHIKMGGSAHSFTHGHEAANTRLKLGRDLRGPR